MPRPILPLSITPEQRDASGGDFRPTAPHRDHRRASIVLHRADGLSQAETARRLAHQPGGGDQVGAAFSRVGPGWPGRRQGAGAQAEHRPEGARADRPRGNAPEPNRTRWSVRAMAAAIGVARRPCNGCGAPTTSSPMRRGRSNCPTIALPPAWKFWDVIGLYLNPPDRALVLCCDEKSQCQALERTQPGLCHARPQPHCRRTTCHGTVTLFAALSPGRQDIQPDRRPAYASATRVPQTSSGSCR